MADEVKLYGKAGCPYTAGAREDFQSRGVAFQEFDVQKDATALAQMLQVNGGLRRVPTIVQGRLVTVGFRGEY
jgi:glutaredoxin